MSKIITLRLEDKKVKTIEEFCEKNKIKQSKLIKSLLENFFKLQDEIMN